MHSVEFEGLIKEARLPASVAGHACVVVKGAARIDAATLSRSSCATEEDGLGSVRRSAILNAPGSACQARRYKTA